MNKQRMTPSKLKALHESRATRNFFFTRKSMSFFGDTMANYYVPAKPVVVKRSSVATFTCWELQRKKPVKCGLSESTYFCVNTYARIIGEKL